MLATIDPVPAVESLPLLAALGRVAARDALAPLNLPPFCASAMDGYALRSTDALRAPSAPLEVIGTSSAGHPFRGAVPPGTCVRIYTGAAVPDGLDAVAIQEDCTLEGNRVIVHAPAQADDNIRSIGHDVTAGATVVQAGTRIREFQLAWLAACGIAEVVVRTLPRVALFSTGDELVEPGGTLAAGQIHDANRHALRALLGHLPVELVDLGILPDREAAIDRMLAEAAREFDAVITSGGVSVGDADYVKQAVARLGEIAFWRINLKPGKPLAYGRLGRAIFIGLPGNPVSTIVTALLLAAPALLRLAGAEPEPVTRVRAQLDHTITHRPGREEYQRGRMFTAGDMLHVSATGDQSSNRLASFAAANCLIRIPKQAADLEAGSLVEVLPFRGLL
jgi:molybdopterin molybdotransferase